MPYALSLFISYSHKDEKYVDALKKHLVTLRRKEKVKDWHDRQLIASDVFDEELRSQLLRSDLVLFVVSIDFLNSWYCYEVELKETLNRASNENIRVIPVIIRHCKWKDTELSKYLCANKDGKPIADADDEDAAWVEVVDAIENVIDKELAAQTKERDQRTLSTTSFSMNLSDGFADYLSNTEVAFSHQHKDKILLDDIYVFPDLKIIKQDYDEIGASIRADSLTNPQSVKNKILVLGSEQSGKTSLAKMLFKTYYSENCIPLLCRGKQINDTDFEKLLRQLIAEQYAGLTVDTYVNAKKKCVLIVDDYNEIGLNSRFQRKFLDSLFGDIDIVVIISNNSILYDESKYVELAEFEQYEILPFGNLRRGELIEKWNCIGREETICIKELHDEIDRITSHVNAIIRKNVLPQKPIYILTIIQLLETSKPTDYSLTSYGHCYQSLIQSNFIKANVNPRDFDTYINYLTEFAFFIYNLSTGKANESEYEEFKKIYSKQYLIQSHDSVLEKLLASGVLRTRNDFLEFGYRYIYYFYVAKYLADHLEHCENAIEHLCENMHTEENANILIFLVHHSKDGGIIDEILLHASVVFDGVKEARLDTDDTRYLLQYIASIPKLVIEQKDIEAERKTRLEKKDDMERLEESISEEKSDDDLQDNALSEINRSARLVEIIGQILRNRYGSLKKEQLKDLSLSAYTSGLRFLNFFLTTTQKEQEYLIDLITNIIREGSTLNEEQITKQARNIFLMFCYGTSYSVIKKIAISLGSDKLTPIFDDINENDADSPAKKLIHIAILLEFTKSIPKKEIAKLFSEVEGNPISKRLLQELVVQHLYLNHVDYKDRQWISSKMHLPINTQRLIQSKDEYKT